MRVALRTHALAIAAWLWAAAFLFATRTQPLRMNWGDPWSDANVMTSGRYFAKYGFARLAFTPILDVGPLDADSMRYTHYPPLPDILNGIQQRLFGEVDISTFRFLADVLALTSLVFLFRWVRSLWGPVTANVTIVLMTTSLIWLQYADTIHHVPIYWFLGFGILERSAVWIEAPEKRSRAQVGLVLVATILCDLASYDFFVFLPVLVAATIWIKGQRLRDRAMRPLLAAVIAGTILAVVVKFALIAWSVGPRNLADDLLFQLHERATSKHSTEYRRGILPIFFFRSLRFFTPLFFVAFAAQLVALGRRLLRRGDSARAANLPPASPLFLLLAGVPFVAAFSQLFVEQYHPTLQFLPYYAVGVASGIAWLWEQRTRAARALAVFAVLFALVWEGRELVSFEKMFLHREDIAAVQTYLAAHDKRRVVYTNSGVDGPLRYYFERHARGIGSYTTPQVKGEVLLFFEDSGADSPVHFFQVKQVEKLAFDKMLYALFSRDQNWRWIADPVPHRHEWLEMVKHRDDGAIAAFEELGKVVVDTERVRLIAVDPAELERRKLAQLGSEDTRLIDFSDEASLKHKVRGVRLFNEFVEGKGHCWTMESQPKRWRFTLQGLYNLPDGPVTTTAEFRLRATPALARLRIMIYGDAPDQEVDIALNGTSVGRAKVVEEWKEIAIEIPKEAFDPTGVQKLEIKPSKLNVHHVGVALRWIRLDPI